MLAAISAGARMGKLIHCKPGDASGDIVELHDADHVAGRAKLQGSLYTNYLAGLLEQHQRLR